MIDLLKSGIVSEEATKDEVIERWNKLGFLQGLEGVLKEECAICFEKMALYLINEMKEEDGFFEAAAFPIIRRVLVGGEFEEGIGSFDGKFNPKEIKEFFNSNFEKCKEAARQQKDLYLDVNGEFDEEAVAITFLCNNLILTYKNNEKEQEQK
ncbi:MAG: hypothetical protein J6X18_06725 [Bacteroidales bacterium]|nr:hypothetical protein [Bacteroidales bacterium]